MTLVLSALLVIGGFAILDAARDLRLVPPPSPTGSTPVAPTGRVDGVQEPGPVGTPGGSTSPSTAASTAASGTASSPSPSLTTRPPAPLRTATTSAPPPAEAAGQVVDLVNAARSRAGCAPVSVNPALRSAAQGHSDDMAARDYFSHTSPDGSTFAGRIRSAGYLGGAIAENIAAGQPSAESVMNAWMASPGHRANILNCAYRDIGVGHASGGTYGSYWTQTFGG
ncbi:hypothetical protein GCM10009868_06490 [Terrabacter aerolatus]|uniref:SCP domain-containing protein n=1 Tax=Terrabacter aerolatus TaxID=422442 RepID=A0A512D117_9MICO|nr:hypothetical protein TAE01_19660 [Terrabacter aerolatus]